jgi:hypothetical protein
MALACTPSPGHGIIRYDELAVGVSDLYDNAKIEHAKGIQLLVKEFDYHPMFKTQAGGFTASPFRPK